MKSYFFPVLLLLTMVEMSAFPTVEAYVPGAGITNTPHDLSASSTYYPTRRYNPEGETEICIFCHLPHDSAGNVGTNTLPLWNHALSAVASYEVYSSGPVLPNNRDHRLSADVSGGPGPVSMFCLSCHDGSVAVNRYGALPGSVFITGRYRIGGGGELTNVHPIGFSYSGVVDDEINQNPLLGVKPLSDLLWEGRMECATCHDVHNAMNSGEKFLRISDRNSNLCCACHRKCVK